MISAQFRFHGHGSLRYLFKNAGAVRSRLMTIKYIRNKHRTKCRFAVIVSKKVHKSAVGRNRMRRRLYEIIRDEQPNLNATYDIALIITSAEVLSAPASELRAMIREMLTRAGMYS